jgi:hypothetical protein
MNQFKFVRITYNLVVLSINNIVHYNYFDILHNLNIYNMFVIIYYN